MCEERRLCDLLIVLKIFKELIMKKHCKPLAFLMIVMLLLASVVLTSCDAAVNSNSSEASADTDTDEPKDTGVDTDIDTDTNVDPDNGTETETRDPHALVQYPAKAPTCLDVGWEAYDACAAGDHSTYVEIPALGHDYSENEDICSRCGAFRMPTLYFTEYDDTEIPVADLLKDDGEINVLFRFDSNGSDYPDFEGAAKIKVQGASSALKPKKNFTIKLYKDATFESKNKVDLGWGKQNKYCMKANYVDSSQARNIVGARMFAQVVATRNYIHPNLLAAPNLGMIDGFPIVVYINGEFHGLYTMNIPKDDWQFAMEGDETTKEVILMADQWSDSVSLLEEIGTGAFEDYGWEIEYSSTEDTEWIKDSFNEIIRLINCGDKERIRAELADHLDIEAAIDNFLFVYFIDAADNKAKNTIWVTYDGVKWMPSMYDMDGTFGIYYNGKILTDDLHTTLSINEDGTYTQPQSNQLHCVLLECFAEEVAARWAYLRQDILTVENTRAQFEAFFADIPDIVYQTEFAKWTKVPNREENRTNMYASTEAQLERLDAFFYSFAK